MHERARVTSRVAATVAGAALLVGLAVSGPPGLAVAHGQAQAQAPARTPLDVSKLGPQVGETVPDFNLPDQNGKVWTRQSIMGPKGAMLVFVRSADW